MTRIAVILRDRLFYLASSRLLKNVFEAASARQKSAKKRSLHVVNEHFEPIFNAAMATQIVFQQPARLLPQIQYLALALLLPGIAFGHNISESNAQFVEGMDGPAIAPFMYLGAKHMVTGYDHLLFLVGVIFFLYKLRDVVLYVTLFTIGHSVTLLAGVLAGLQVNAYLIDAIIGFSIVYKAFENMGGFEKVFGIKPDTRVAVLIFGLFHGLGLATKLQEFSISENGLLANIISFNVGVELGQIIALTAVLLLLLAWRRWSGFARSAFLANSLLMTGGFLLAAYQLTGFFVYS